jgi:glucose-6-phosphate isomerase
MTHLARPLLVSIDVSSGHGPEFTSEYEKSFGDLQGVYRDKAAFAALKETSAAEAAYRVFATTGASRSGELIVGTSTLQPGKVGDEFNMTRGHIHEIHDRSEMYYCLSGHGVMLLESLDGETEAIEMRTAQMVYVPGGWIHRSVNVGDDALVTLFCYPSDSGQDYSIIERSNGMAKLVVEDREGHWKLRDNPDYIPRR